MAEKHVVFAYDLDADNSDEDALAKFIKKYKPLLLNKKEYPSTTAVFSTSAETSEDAKQEIRGKIKKWVNEIKTEGTRISFNKFFFACCTDEEFY
jgi:menaquinone-dependent protoporphyrinogen IX oxidase